MTMIHALTLSAMVVCVPDLPCVFPRVLIKTPNTTVASDRASEWLIVSMPQATAVAAEVMGSAALMVSTNAAEDF